MYRKRVITVKRRLQATVVLAALGAVVLAGCSSGSSGSDASSGTTQGNATQTISELQVGSAPVSTLNYDDSNIGYSSGLGNLVLEPLLVETKSEKIEPWLAQSWKQVNPTTYVYNLRHGVKFSDGDAMTSADVVFSWNYYREQGSDNAYNFPTTLKSITATGPYTVTVTLSKPDAAWAVVPTGAMLGIFEKKFYEAHKSTFGQPGTGLMGTGPWSITSFDPTTGAQLAANPYYWGGAVRIKKISWTFYSTETSEALAFRAGGINLAFPTENQSFASTAGTTLTSAPGSIMEGDFEMNTAAKPWNSIYVRKAVAYALNKPGLIAANGGYATPINTLITPAMLDGLGTPAPVTAVLDSLPAYPYNLAKAKQEMAKSPYPNGVNVTLAVDNTPSFINVSQAIVSQLAQIGIHATLDVEQSAAWTAQITGADRAAIPSQYVTNGADSLDPGEGFNFAIGSANATAGNWNSTNWSNPTVDNLIAEGFTTTNSTARLNVYKQLLTQFAQNVPFVPVFLIDGTVALSSQYTWPSFDSFYLQDGPWALGIQAKS
jgi:peptide/nickel transport system substrate-binding protein